MKRTNKKKWLKNFSEMLCICEYSNVVKSEGNVKFEVYSKPNIKSSFKSTLFFTWMPLFRVIFFLITYSFSKTQNKALLEGNEEQSYKRPSFVVYFPSNITEATIFFITRINTLKLLLTLQLNHWNFYKEKVLGREGQSNHLSIFWNQTWKNHSFMLNKE